MGTTHHEETTPALREADDGTEDGHETALQAARAVNVKATVSIVTVLIALAMFSSFMSIPAQNVIFEQIICDQYFSTSNGTSRIPFPPKDGTSGLQDPCKAVPVQSELGYVIGWKDTFEVLPSLIISVPFGMLADRIGRRPIMFNALFWTSITEVAARIVCYWPEVFPLRTVWYVNVLNLLGGGPSVASSMIFTIIADITTPDKRADIYVIIMGALLIAESAGTPLGAALADIAHPWIAYMAAPIGIFLSAFCAFAITETRPEQPKRDPDLDRSWSQARVRKLFTSRRPRTWPRTLARQARYALQALWRNFSLMCLVVVFFTSLVRRQAQGFLVLYASKKFDWPLSRASYLSALRSAVNLVLLLLILPAVTHRLLRYLSAARKDLVLLRVQAGLITLGAALIAIAEHPVLMIAGVVVIGLGAGFEVNARSLATSLVQRTHFATLNTALALSEALGVMCAGPVLASTWHQGLVLGGAWLGLPFAMAALVFAAALLVTGVIRVKDAEDEGELQEEEQESLLHENRA